MAEVSIGVEKHTHSLKTFDSLESIFKYLEAHVSKNSLNYKIYDDSVLCIVHYYYDSDDRLKYNADYVCGKITDDNNQINLRYVVYLVTSMIERVENEYYYHF